MHPIKVCRDCQGHLEQIELLDATNPGRRGPWDPIGAQHKVASYGKVGSRPHWFHGRRDIQGKVRGFMCQGCGRIYWYGEPIPKSS